METIEMQCPTGCPGAGEWNHSCTSQFFPISDGDRLIVLRPGGVTTIDLNA